MLLFLLTLLTQAAPGRPAFASSSELVVLHVCVLDRHAGFVPSLPRDAFAVYDDGRPQPIAFFENDDTPVSVGLLIDSSGSMQPRREAVIAAGTAFAESSRPDDEMFTLNFNEEVWPGLPPGRAFTSDHHELHEALRRSGARGQTALFDAIQSGLKHLDGGKMARRVLIVISDGGDNASRARFQDVLDEALRRDVVIYSVGIYDRDDRDARPKLLRELAAVTGGEAFFPDTIEQVRPALERIARDIRSSYTIGYIPPPDGRRAVRTHAVRVDVRPEGGRRLTVRSRSAYVRSQAEARDGRQ